MPPNPRPIPRFIADSTQEGIPHGRFAERLRESFVAAVDELGDLPAGVAVPEELDWFPERAWGGRVWVPCSAHSSSEEGEIELFGHVSYVQPAGGEPSEFEAKVDFTDILAADNPEWRIDLNDDVIGRWRGENGRDGEAVDQELVSQERFTLVALDALEAYGDDIFMQVKLWSRRGLELASESLYAA
jgi:hypothetical protein